MKKITYVASCLSERIIKKILKQRPEISLIGGLRQMRLDILRDCLASGVPAGAPEVVVAGLLEKVPSSVKAEYQKKLAMQITEQTSKIIDNLRSADCLLLDNNYDLSVHLVEYREGDRTYRLCNVPPVDGVATDLGKMPLESARTIYQSIVDRVHEINPSTRIIFLQYPISGFELALQSADTDVERRITNRLKRARQLAENLVLDDAYVVPMVAIPEQHVDPRGAYYFSDEVYHAYANVVLGVIDGRAAVLPKPDPTTKEIPFPEFCMAAAAPSMKPRSGESPYDKLPDRNYWKPAVGDRLPLAIEGLYERKFEISREDRITTTGSCFAQHIGRHLKVNGFNLLDVEPAPPEMARNEWITNGYGLYSARYGNIYTSRQLLQLMQRAFGELKLDEIWESDGRYYDPFRPNLQPGGYLSAQALRADRELHLAKVRGMFEQTDILIFTMGLTECWRNRQTEAVYPMCPGVTVGKYDANLHKFKNLSFGETRRDMEAAIEMLRRNQPNARILLTVSPVPLTATAEYRHVLVSTTYSKSVLRAVAGDLASRYAYVDYFPSYEIVTAPPFRGVFFESNMRTVREDGVDFVMSHFFSQHGGSRSARRMVTIDESDELCDEAFLELERESAKRRGA